MSGKRAARHAQPTGRKRGLIGAGAVAVVAIVVALIAALGGMPGTSSVKTDGEASSSPSSSAEPAPSESAESPSSTPSSEPAPVEARLSKPARACAASIREEERAIDAAEIGVRNWKDHVQARTDMLEGRMSMERMDAVWARTKAAGPSDQERFEKAVRAYDRPSGCRGLRGTSASGDKVAARCVRRSRAADRALDSAEAAMRDWEVHLANMRMYADDEMSAAMAQDKWVQSWRNAPRNISAYREARAALAKTPACARVA